MNKEPTKIFVCSPYRPKSSEPAEALAELQENMARAREACRLLVKLGNMPMCPHLYFTSIFDDMVEEERIEGMLLGQQWLSECEECWCFGDTISEGMAEEIALAKEMGIPVRMMPEPKVLVEELIQAMKESEEI